VSTELFVDTSAWYPIAVPAHPDHAILADALAGAIRGGRRVVTTNLIVAESHALLLSRAGRRAALGFLRAVRQSPNEVVSTTPDLEDRAIAHWLERYEDKDFSLADGVSFEVMSGRGIRQVLTLDHHFSAAGFVMAPAP
jgi:predicted nucleic acid-binding protein